MLHKNAVQRYIRIKELQFTSQKSLEEYNKKVNQRVERNDCVLYQITIVWETVALPMAVICRFNNV